MMRCRLRSKEDGSEVGSGTRRCVKKPQLRHERLSRASAHARFAAPGACALRADRTGGPRSEDLRRRGALKDGGTPAPCAAAWASAPCAGAFGCAGCGLQTAPPANADRLRILRISGQLCCKNATIGGARCGGVGIAPPPDPVRFARRGGAQPAAPLRQADARRSQGRGRGARRARAAPAPTMQGRSPSGPLAQGDSRVCRHLRRGRRGTGFAPGAWRLEAMAGGAQAGARQPRSPLSRGLRGNAGRG